MPKIAEIKEIDGAVWARVEMEAGSPVQFLNAAEIDAARQREMRQLDEIDRLLAWQREARAWLAQCLGHVTGEGPPHWDGIRAFLAIEQQAPGGSRDG